MNKKQTLFLHSSDAFEFCSLDAFLIWLAKPHSVAEACGPKTPEFSMAMGRDR